MTAESARAPVLLVHGLDDSSRAFEPLARHLRARGWAEIEAVDLLPNDGSAGLHRLAEQVQAAAQALRERTAAPRIDVVAFSMGAIAARIWLTRQGGLRLTRKFVSLSGPHHGTWLGWLRRNEGARQLRPGSPLLADLSRDEGQWGEVQVASIWTPLDLMILPASSSRLLNAECQTIPVAAHPLVLRDARVFRAVERLLLQG